jgi:hypothetical protein
MNDLSTLSRYALVTRRRLARFSIGDIRSTTNNRNSSDNFSITPNQPESLLEDVEGVVWRELCA